MTEPRPPRPSAYHFDANIIRQTVPPCLGERHQWVTWNYEFVELAWTKVPGSPIRGGKASSTDSGTWGSLEKAITACERGGLNGVGFVFSADDEFCGVDLDHCIDPMTTCIKPWAMEIIRSLNSYAEYSPSQHGIKIFVKGTKPGTRCKTGYEDGAVEIYEKERFFTFTGQHLNHTPSALEARQTELNDLYSKVFARRVSDIDVDGTTEPKPNPHAPADDIIIRILEHSRVGEKFKKLWKGEWQGSYGSQSEADLALVGQLVFMVGADPERIDRLFRRSGLDREKWERADYRQRTINKALEGRTNFYDPAHDDSQFGYIPNYESVVGASSAESASRDPPSNGQQNANSGNSTSAPDDFPRPLSIEELIAKHPHLRDPVIHNLLRAGETMNIIAPSKTGKSWLVNDLAFAIASGTPWLETFDTEPGEVLIIDNELHPETSASRFTRIANARELDMGYVKKRVFVQNMRGRLQDLLRLGSYFDSLERGKYRVIILDAFYRFMPKDMDENDNGTMAGLYNYIDLYADKLRASFILIHHSTKGNQSNRAITDVGAGAGAQSRAADTHLILRNHQEPGVVVLDAAVRSWAPIEPICLKWDFPVWKPATGLDPTALKPEKPPRPKKEGSPKAPKEEWTVQRFVSALLTKNPIPKDVILGRATQTHHIPGRAAKSLLDVAQADRLIFQWTYPKDRKVYFATVEQSLMDTK